MNKTIQTLGFRKKQYERPEQKVFEVGNEDIIATSPNQVKQSNEEYETGNTSGWF